MPTLILSLPLMASLLTACSLSPPQTEKSQAEEAVDKEPVSPNKKTQLVNTSANSSAIIYPPEEVASICVQYLKRLPGKYNQQKLTQACEKTRVLQGCSSWENRPIFHYDRLGKKKKGKRILTMSLIHGDEFPSGSVARSWMTRLERLNPRNHWRVIPVMNPDGMKRGTRTNARRVDLNRNFPTSNWDGEALYKWKIFKKEDPRRYPGPRAASEVETRCALKHIEGFQPDFIISIHTPLGLLDFDGPKDKYPHFKPLPWISLGHFPGSLGRYMWADRNIPVLTIELKGDQGIHRLEQFDRLQDISGTVAIQAGKANPENKKKKSTHDE